ncbi:hypothetical protein GFY24_30285 [Nocardia sp. SYP-A9097]|uniref:trypsin-like peptidase domain-containing protein n=1 Tax=Nocardia sp. SYP-A9097 TaxID=2663237 RepID=UPI00129B5F7E|nr:trypsin-like peptidase domain-containing protein [Nocardia sp. SYP-A9097]MRH91679.1 hypothetical protein [Nocardia sp. SYP-A9097]
MTLVQQRVVEVLAHGADVLEHGSGYLVGPGTVLTAGHVVAEGERFSVRSVSGEQEWAATVIWASDGANGSVDAAVLRLRDKGLPEWMRTAAPVRYGRAITRTGTIAARAQGFPRAQRRGEARGIEPFEGRIKLGGDARLHRLQVEVEGGAPAGSSRVPWAGMSGAAVWSGPLLVGVVIEDPAAWAHGRLTFEPMQRLLRDPEFTRALLGDDAPTPAVDAIELSILDRGHQPPRPTSPAQLLRAEIKAVEFYGRTTELWQLEEWCGDADTGVMLIHGPGGQGKTRLALEWVDRLRARGWACGVARADLRDLRSALADTLVEQAVTQANAPVLIMIDYAEAWRRSADDDDPVRKLLQVMANRDSGQSTPVRVLLVARSPGTWWSAVTGDDRVPAREMELRPLAKSGDIRPELYRNAVSALAARLRSMTGYQEVDWPRIARRVRPLHALGKARYRHALSLFEQALADLLQAGPEPFTIGASETAEDVLLHHESKYWDRTAAAHGMRYTAQTQAEAVAALTLFGAENEAQATCLVASLRVFAKESLDEHRRVVKWLGELYPGHETSWAPLEPDRLGEHLVARIWGGTDELLAIVEKHLLWRDRGTADDSLLGDEQIHRMFIVLDRAAPDHPDLDRLLSIARSYLLTGGGRAERPESDAGAYRYFDGLRAGVPADELHRLLGSGLDSSVWQCNWTWWNLQRPARIISASAQVHLTIAEFDGTPHIVLVNSAGAEAINLVTGRRSGRHLFWVVKEGSVISSACSLRVNGDLHIGVGFENGGTEVWRIDKDGTGGWVGPPPDDPGSEGFSHRVRTMTLAEVNGRLLVITAAWHAAIWVRDVETGQQVAELPDATGGANAMTVVERSGRPLLVTACDDSRIRVYDLSANTLLHTTGQHADSAICLAVLDNPRRDGAPDELQVLAGGLGGDIHLIDVTADVRVATLTGHSQQVSAVCVDRLAGMPIVVSTGHDRRVIVWDLYRGEPIGEAFVGHTDRVNTLALGRVGKRLMAVTSGADFTTRVWDVSEIRTPEAPLVGHTNAITAVCFVRDERRMIGVTASKDLTIRTWNLDRGGRLGAPGLEEMYPLRRIVTALAATRCDDGVVIVAGDVDGYLMFVEPDAPPGSSSIWLEHAIAGLDCRVIGSEVVMAAMDNTGTVRGWRVSTREPLGPAAEAPGGSTVRQLRVFAREAHPYALITAKDSACIVDLVTGEIENYTGPSEFDGWLMLGTGLVDDRPYVFAGGQPGTANSCLELRAFDAQTGTESPPAQHIPDRTRLVRLEHTEHGPALLVGGDHGEVWLRDLRTDLGANDPPVAVAQLGWPNQIAAAVVDRPAGPALLIGGQDGELELIDAKSGLSLTKTEPVNPTSVTIAGYAGKPTVIIAAGSRKVVCRDLRDGSVTGVPTALRGGRTLLRTVTVDGREILVAGGYLGIQVWYSDSMTPIAPESELWRKVNNVVGPTGVVRVDERIAVITAHDRELLITDLMTGEALRPALTDLPDDGRGHRFLVAAEVIEGRPILFVAAHLGSTIRTLDLRTGTVIDTVQTQDGITHLALGTANGRAQLYIAHLTGDISVWSVRNLLRGRLRRFVRPHPIDTVSGVTDVSALSVHPGLGLLAARDDILELRPLDPADPMPIHLDAPILGIASRDNTLAIVSEQGVVVLEIDANRLRHRGTPGPLPQQ